MPRVTLLDPYGMNWQIATMNEATLRSWFDEWLPRQWPDALLGSGLPDPRIIVYPLWTEMKPNGIPGDPDWLTDSRVTGQPFRIPWDPALAIGTMKAMRAELEQKIADADARGERFIP